MPTTQVPITEVDCVTFALGAATIMLAIVAIGVAIGAIFAYKDIKKSAVEAARSEARRTAENVAARQFSDKLAAQNDTDQTGVVSAYSEP